ncbi:MAG: NADH-quinone oxidoreductase subunit NuoE [Acidobacteria bacterium]|nr:NADH-quinone oxidoreductase subunit NuoE [Acidobacteriota bacterium]
MLSEEANQQIQALMSKYPQKRSALIPSLLLAQKEAGYLTNEIVCEIARIFDLTPNEVYEVATFYTMLYKKPVGKYVIQVCTNISCMLCNAEKIVEHLTAKLGIGFGETTPDGKYTLLEVECLGSCGTSPVMQINDAYYEELTPEKVDQILDGLG